jgi:hypothetical protein
MQMAQQIETLPRFVAETTLDEVPREVHHPECIGTGAGTGEELTVLDGLPD